MRKRMIVFLRCTLPLLLVVPFLPCLAQTSVPDRPNSEPNLPDAPSSVLQLERQKSQVSPAGGGTPQHVDESWPRTATHGEETISMYQPQLEGWEGDELQAYAALALVSKSDKTTKYGVLWFTARTEVDKVNRQVTLQELRITKVKFPAMEAKAAEYQSFLQAKLPGRSKVIALDRLETALEACESKDAGVVSYEVNNDPPKVILTAKPSLLVLIDGPPQYRDAGRTESATYA